MRFPSKLGLKIWCACWLVLLALPIFRVRLGEIPSKPLIELSGPHWRQGDDDVMAANAAKAQAIRAQFPDEPIALVEALSLEPRGESYARDYLALARRFPKERWLQLGALREGAFGGGGVIETGQDKSKAGVVQEMSRSQRAVYGELLDLAKQLEGREPQNAFPSWMRAYYAFSLGRDAEALQGLQNAARSRGFDDGLRAYLNKVSEWKLRQGATWESLQKSVLDATFPHFHGMRVSANRAVKRRTRQSNSNLERRSKGDKPTFERGIFFVAPPFGQWNSKTISTVFGSEIWRPRKLAQIVENATRTKKYRSIHRSEISRRGLS